jgi:hypothetical protein
LSARWRIWLVAALASTVLAFDYSIAKVDQETRAQRIRFHNAIVQSTADAPFRYRVLVPLVLDPLIRASSQVMNHDAAFTRVYAAFYFIALWALLVLLFQYLRIWFPEREALIAILLVACTLPISLRQHYYAPWSLLEPSFMTGGLLLIRRNAHAALLALTVVATLNRETGVLLPLAAIVHGLHEPRMSRELPRPVGILALAVIMVIGLRMMLGPASESTPLQSIWQINSSREGLLSAVGNVLLFAGVFGWPCAMLGVRRLPEFVRRQLWTAALYLPLYLVWGIWYEVRLLMPLYPVLVPAILCGLFPSAADHSAADVQPS